MQILVLIGVVDMEALVSKDCSNCAWQYSKCEDYEEHCYKCTNESEWTLDVEEGD